MTKRDKIIQAAVNIEGSAVMLSEKWDCYLIGYTIPEGTKTVLGVYDMTGLVRGDIDREDAVIEEMKAINGGLKPVLVHTWYNICYAPIYRAQTLKHKSVTNRNKSTNAL